MRNGTIHACVTIDLSLYLPILVIYSSSLAVFVFLHRLCSAVHDTRTRNVTGYEKEKLLFLLFSNVSELIKHYWIVAKRCIRDLKNILNTVLWIRVCTSKTPPPLFFFSRPSRIRPYESFLVYKSNT